MDLFDQWDGDQGLSPDTSPSRPTGFRAGGTSGSHRGGMGDEYGVNHEIFSLRRVDWASAGSRGAYRATAARTIRSVVVQSNIMVLATNDCVVIRWNVDSASDPEEIEVSRRAEDRIYKLFMDLTGNHVVIAMENGENYYLHSRSTKPKKLKAWQGQAGRLESIAWDKWYGREASTKSILVGDNQGHLFETALEHNSTKERPLNRVYDFEHSLPILGLEFELLNSPSDPEPRILVLAATCNPVRLYKFLGGPTFEALFARHRESGHMSFQELGGSPSFQCTELHLFGSGHETPSYSMQPSSATSQYLALLTENGIYHGKLALSPPPSSADADILRDTSMYLTEGKDAPQSMGLSEFHFLLLFAKKLQVVSKLNSKLVQETVMDSTQGTVKALLRDVAAGTFWLYSDRSIFQVIVRDEDRDVWRLYLDKALAGGSGAETGRNFEAAYQYCKDPRDRAQVHAAQADFYFRNGQSELAAKYYAMTPSSFEEVALKFVDDGQENALRVFLMEKLDRLGGGLGGSMGKGEGAKAQYKTQRVMLCTWLTEIFLKRIAALEGPGQEAEHRLTVSEFQNFLRSHIDDLRIHPPTTYDLLASYGRREETLLYATLIEDLDTVIATYVRERCFDKALQVLESAAFERVESFFYKYSYALMDAQPTRTVTAWMSKPGLNPTRLIPALVRYLQRQDDDSASSGQRGVDHSMATRYLEHCIATSKGHADPAIYNYLLQLYAQQPDETDLLRFLVNTEKEAEATRYSSGASSPSVSSLSSSPLDLKYALRVCSHHAKRRACVQIYAFMELYEEAVELALRVDVSLAKVNADKAPSDELRKRLWLLIARHLIEVVKVKVKEAIALLDECPLLQIEDILPFFPDFVVIDDFKPEICKSLQDYSEKIKSLKSEMEEYSQSSAEIEKKIEELRARHLPLLPNQPCRLCDSPAFTQQFYLFPCRHAFHSECLGPHVLPHLNPAQRRAVRDLQQALAAELASISATGGNPRKAAQVETLQAEIDGFLAAECPLCGDFMIRSVNQRLITEEEEAKNAKEWEID